MRPLTLDSDTYAQLLEQENEQPRLKNQQLRLRIRCLETKVDADKEHRRASTQEADDALKIRDKLVGEIVETIISEFQRYKQIVAKDTEDCSAEITIYSQFDVDMQSGAVVRSDRVGCGDVGASASLQPEEGREALLVLYSRSYSCQDMDCAIFVRS